MSGNSDSAMFAVFLTLTASTPKALKPIRATQHLLHCRQSEEHFHTTFNVQHFKTVFGYPTAGLAETAPGAIAPDLATIPAVLQAAVPAKLRSTKGCQMVCKPVHFNLPD